MRVFNEQIDGPAMTFDPALEPIAISVV